LSEDCAVASPFPPLVSQDSFLSKGNDNQTHFGFKSMKMAGGGSPYEEARPFPKMSSPPVSTVSSPTPSSLGSTGSYDDRDGPSMGLDQREDRGSGVHPGANVFNWGSNDSETAGPGASSDGNGPVTLTNLTPISPSNEDVHSSDQYKHPQPSLLRYGMNYGIPGCSYFGFNSLNQPTTIFTMPENEKYRKMMIKKQKRIKNKEKNVMNVYKAEGKEFDMESVLQSIGESVDEENKSKVKKTKEKPEKTKPVKKDKKKSLENTSKDSDKEEDDEEEEEIEATVVEKEVKTSRNKFVEDDLKSFKQNFYLVSTDQNKSRENLQGSEDSPQASFTKVTSKKNRVKKSKDEAAKPVPAQDFVPRSFPSTVRSREFEVEKKEPVKRMSSDIILIDSNKEKVLESEAPKLAKDDFPALPGGADNISENAQSLMACAWAKVVTKASDTNIDNSEESKDNNDDDQTVFINNDCDEAKAVIDIDTVPKPDEEEEVGEAVDDETKQDIDEDNAICDEEIPTNNNKVEVITTEDEFDKKETNKESPVVIFSENCQDWTSSEFTFGFDVNEELVANTNTVENVANNDDNIPSCPAQYYMAPDTLDMHDNAILSFGPEAAMGHTRPLIVGVPVGVPIPVSSFNGLPFYPGPAMFPGPVYNLQYPHEDHVSMEDHELMAEKMAANGAAEAEDQTISPESGISSSSPLSWQPDSSPSLPAPGCYRDRNLPLVSQVSESLSNWSGHGSDHDEDTTIGPGWATQVEQAETVDSSGQDSGLGTNKTEKFNFLEIVNFVSDSWSSVTEDNSVQVFQT